ncbi:MAG: hypothetical protein K2H01_02145 [Ruminococcus sp.]|nr:hypothetical protein [Ruminococcus sp.]
MDKNCLDFLIMLFKVIAMFFKTIVTLFKSGAAELHVNDGIASFKVDLNRLVAHA